MPGRGVVAQHRLAGQVGQADGIAAGEAVGSRESDHFRVIEKRGNHEVGTGDGGANPGDVDAVDPDTIDAMFVPGGAGPMEDLYDDRDLGRILVALQARTAPVATVCHGTIGLLSARRGAPGSAPNTR